MWSQLWPDPGDGDGDSEDYQLQNCPPWSKGCGLLCFLVVISWGLP